MDLLISDNWLREFLKTSATPKQIAANVSLCGPSFEKITKSGNDYIYSIEVTTNRVDSASVYGIAREANAILPRFGIKSRLQPIKTSFRGSFVNKVNYLDAQVDSNLCPRFSAVLIKNVTIKPSPSWMTQRLVSAGERPINNVVDISNFVMHEIGQPVHTFDYDKIGKASSDGRKKPKMILRQSNRGEEITTLDGRRHTLAGGDIVIEDGEGKLIDLAGIMGGKLSAIDSNTKNVLLFVQTYNPVNIRRTYMSLAQGTQAAVLFEKGLDPELVDTGIKRAVELFENLTQGVAETEILNIYPNPYKAKKISLNIDFIEKYIGVKVKKSEISKHLNALDFETSWNQKNLEVLVPSFRARDIEIAQDVVEEVARIYGYFNLPGKIMQGAIPEPLKHSTFKFENKVKQILKGYGGTEVYTPSLVSKEQTSPNALKLKNPLGTAYEYLRTSLLPSLLEVINQNRQEKEPFWIFEMANIYLPKKNHLPQERLTLAGIFSNTAYRKAKGIVESFLKELNIAAVFTPEDAKYFLASHRATIKSKKQEIGELGILEEKGLIYFEFPIEDLYKLSSDVGRYKPIPKYPPQIEDITFTFPSKTKMGDVQSLITNFSSLVTNVELRDIYKDSYTFRVWYQHPTKTLTDKEVEKLRNKIAKEVKSKFGGIVKN